MHEWPTRQDAGGTPQEGVFFYNETGYPLRHRDLNMADAMQLGLDYLGDPLAHDELLRFRGKFIDEIESFASILKDFKAREGTHRQRDASYQRLHEWAAHPDETIAVALRAAGRSVWSSESELIEDRRKLHAAGEGLTRQLVEHFNRRLPDRQGVVINGVRYDFWNGVLTIRRTIQHGGKGTRVTLFAGDDVLTEHARRYHRAFTPPDHPSNRRVKEFGEIASPDDWADLLHNLATIAKF